MSTKPHFYHQVSNIVVVCLLLLILGRFWVVGTSKILFNAISSDGDESAYLALGLDLREVGTLTDGTRPPLYPLLLATVAERDWAYFTSAKFLTLALGTLAVLATFFIGRQLYNPWVGLGAAFLLALNNEFHLRASTIYADTLLVSIFLGAWYFLIRSVEGRRHLIWAGIFSGLAYLTKGSAPLLLGAWAVLVVVYYGRKVFTQWQLLLVPVIFVLVISPLLVYNARHFDSPFYNFATTHVMWMDRWAESQVADATDLPTLRTYLQSHTGFDMVQRLFNGSDRLNQVLSRTLIPTRVWQPPWLGNLLMVILLAIGGYAGLFHRQQMRVYLNERRYIFLYSTVLFAAFYLFSAWYAEVMMESRFLIPILGPFYLLVADLFISPIRRWGVRMIDQNSTKVGYWIYTGGVTIGLLGVASWLISSAYMESWSLTVDPYRSDREANQASDAVLNWLTAEVPADPVQITFGPSKSLPLWKFPRRMTVTRIPVDLHSWADFDAYLAASPPDYVVIDSDTARRRRTILNPHFSYDDTLAGITQIPPGWALRHVAGNVVCEWCIFDPYPVPNEVVTANLANFIELQGYDRRLNPAERQIDINLYWRALTDIEQDYTIFLHVTAPDGFVKVQQDSQPFQALWPTSFWREDEQFITGFTLPLNKSVQPGEYLLITGMYLLETGERLPLISGPIAPSPNGILLGSFEVDNAELKQ